ncbi:hypothetical protein Syun_017651 [Stephania yunnanensis]|uniref:Uncharacterized protein n=1 Tax=Stephania yunnanensis TaxID=152371 RepID=A0AAP0J7H1_9MAGN
MKGLESHHSLQLWSFSTLNFFQELKTSINLYSFYKSKKNTSLSKLLNTLSCSIFLSLHSLCVPIPLMTKPCLNRHFHHAGLTTATASSSSVELCHHR